MNFQDIKEKSIFKSGLHLYQHIALIKLGSFYVKKYQRIRETITYKCNDGTFCCELCSTEERPDKAVDQFVFWV